VAYRAYWHNHKHFDRKTISVPAGAVVIGGVTYSLVQATAPAPGEPAAAAVQAPTLAAAYPTGNSGAPLLMPQQNVTVDMATFQKIQLAQQLNNDTQRLSQQLASVGSSQHAAGGRQPVANKQTVNYSTS